MITTRPTPLTFAMPGEGGSCSNCGGRGWKFLSLRRSEEAAGDAGECALLRRARTECLACGDRARSMTAATIIRPRRRVFPGSGDQVGRARQFVGQVLGGCPAADDAVLLTSELVTNAITHTASGQRREDRRDRLPGRYPGPGRGPG